MLPLLRDLRLRQLALGDVAGDADDTADGTRLIAVRHGRGLHPADGAIAMNFPVLLRHDCVAGAYDVLLVRLEFGG